MSTGRTSRRPAWVEALGGVVGFALGLGWVLGYGAVLRWIDGTGFSWPLPGPLAWAAFIAIVALTWVPWAPVLVRVGFRWWHVLVAGPLAPVGLMLAATAGARLASGDFPAARHPRVSRA